MRPSRLNSQEVDSVRLASYLSLGVTGALMATAHTEAAVINIDITNLPGSGANISGVNAGMTYDQPERRISNWLGAGTGDLNIYFDNDYVGLDGDNGLFFAQNGGPAYEAAPNNFASGAMIDGSWPNFSDREDETGFYYEDDSEHSPDFGPGSFMGFRFSGDGGATWNYGYLEVLWTWNGNAWSSTFEILGGAYESTVNTGILAGATAPSGVPVPAASLLALMALGGNSFRRSRARAA